MKRIINFRSFMVMALLMIFMILSCSAFIIVNKVLGMVGIALTICVIIAMLILSAFLSHERKYIVTFSISLILNLIVLFSFFQTITNWVVPIQEGQNYKIDATIDYVSKDYENEKVILKNVFIDGKSVKGKLKLDTKDTKFYSHYEGYKISFSAQIYTNDLFSNNEIRGDVYRKDIRYSVYMNRDESYFLTPSPLSVRDKVLNSIQNKLISALGGTYGNIAFSMLTGDKNDLADGITNYFSISGLGHIMAVSGLHIGFIVLLISFIAKKLKVRNYVTVSAVLLFFALYILLIGLSPSVIRAVIMSSIALITLLNGQRKDSLNALGCAVCGILLVSPFFLFEVGFVLSVCAVFGIILFNKPLLHILGTKIHLPRFMSAPLALSISVQIGIVPAMMFYFKQFQVYSIVVNLFMMPLIMVTFLSLLITIFLAMLFNPFTIFLQISGIGMAIIDNVAKFVANLPYSVVITYSSVALLLSYLFYFILSRFVMKGKWKHLINSISILCCLSVLVLPNFFLLQPKFEQEDIFVSIGYGQDVTSLLSSGNKNYIIGDCRNAASIASALYQYNIYQIEAIVIFELNEKVAKELNELTSVFNIKAIYCPQTALASGMNLMIQSGYKNFYSFSTNENPIHNLNPVYIKGKLQAYQFNFHDTSALIVGYKYRYVDLPIELINKSLILRCLFYLSEYEDRIYFINYPLNSEDAKPSYCFVYRYQENLALNVKNGEIIY